MRRWLTQNLIAFDQQINTLLGGMADETLSARAYRMQQKGTSIGAGLQEQPDT